MATIEDLDYKSIIDESKDEAIERLRQIRLSRRTPVKKTKSKKTTSKAAKKKDIENISPEVARKFLELIGDD